MTVAEPFVFLEVLRPAALELQSHALTHHADAIDRVNDRFSAFFEHIRVLNVRAINSNIQV